MANKGLYFAVPPQPGAGNAIEFLSFSSGKTTVLTTTPQPIAWSLSVSANERYLLYSQADRTGSDLMLVENFR